MLRSWSVAATAVIVGLALLTGCSSTTPKVTSPTTTNPTTKTTNKGATTTTLPDAAKVSVTAGPTPTAAQLAFQKRYLAGPGAPLVDFVRKTRPLSGPNIPTRAVCLDMKNNVLPSVTPGPNELEALVAKLTDPWLKQLYVQNIFWLNGLLDACSTTTVPKFSLPALKVIFLLWDRLEARVERYGFTV